MPKKFPQECKRHAVTGIFTVNSGILIYSHSDVE